MSTNNVNEALLFGEDLYKEFEKDISNTKEFNAKLKKIFDEEYNELINDILIDNKKVFINNFESNIHNHLTLIYTNKCLNNKALINNFNNLFNDFKVTYNNDYKLINNWYTSYNRTYSRYLNIYNIDNFRKHCFESDNTLYHYCSELNKSSKLVNIYEDLSFEEFKKIVSVDKEDKKNKSNKEKNGENNDTVNNSALNERTNSNIKYLLCLSCKKVFVPSLITAYCNKCEKNYTTSILPKSSVNNRYTLVTWSSYHCPQLINEKMKCIKCRELLYFDSMTNLLTCLNIKCNFKSKPNRILWTCSTCKSEFKSGVIIYNPLELEIIKKYTKKILIKKEKAHPKRLPCCKLDILSTQFTHNLGCDGLLLTGLINDKSIILCDKCKAINFYDRFIWTCPNCSSRFRNKRASSRVKKTNSNSQNNNNLYNSEKVHFSGKEEEDEPRDLIKVMRKLSLKAVASPEHSNKDNNHSDKDKDDENNYKDLIIKGEDENIVIKKDNKPPLIYKKHDKRVNYSNHNLNISGIENNKNCINVERPNNNLRILYRESSNVSDNESGDVNSKESSSSKGNEIQKNKLNNTSPKKEEVNSPIFNKRSVYNKYKNKKNSNAQNNDNKETKEEEQKPKRVKTLEADSENDNKKNLSDKCKHKGSNNSNNSNSDNIANKDTSDGNKKKSIESGSGSNKSNDLKIYEGKDNDKSKEKIIIIREVESCQDSQVTHFRKKIERILSRCKIPTFNPDEYIINKKVGEGSYGTIFNCSPKTNINKKYALKKILANSMNQIDGYTKEFELLYNCKHSNITEIYGIYIKCFDSTTFCLYALMELADVDWEKDIKIRTMRRNNYTENELVNILSQLVEALIFLQQKINISHRDIKPQNVLIFNNSTIYKLADFGEAKEIKSNRNNNTLRGTELYMSPMLYEGLKHDYEDVVHNPYKSDIYSLGLCFLYAATLNFQILYQIREVADNGNYNQFIANNLKRYSNIFITLLTNMLEIDENKRFDFNKIKNYIENNYKEK